MPKASCIGLVLGLAIWRILAIWRRIPFSIKFGLVYNDVTSCELRHNQMAGKRGLRHNKGGHIGASGRINWFKEDTLVRPGGYFGNWRTRLLKMGGHFWKGGYFGLFWEDTLAQFFWEDTLAREDTLVLNIRSLSRNHFQETDNIYIYMYIQRMYNIRPLTTRRRRPARSRCKSSWWRNWRHCCRRHDTCACAAAASCQHVITPHYVISTTQQLLPSYQRKNTTNSQAKDINVINEI